MKFNPGGVGKRNAGVGNSPVDNLLVVTLVGETVGKLVGKLVVNVAKTVGNVANPVGNVGISRLSIGLSVTTFIDILLSLIFPGINRSD